jgi:hypothetical protein
LLGHASVAKPAIEIQAVEDFVSTCQTSGQTLTNPHSLSDAISVSENFAAVPKQVADHIGKLEKHVVALTTDL